MRYDCYVYYKKSGLFPNWTRVNTYLTIFTIAVKALKTRDTFQISIWVDSFQFTYEMASAHLLANRNKLCAHSIGTGYQLRWKQGILGQ